MSIKLLITLLGLMLANQLVGTSYGAFKEHFNKDKFWYGLWKLTTTAIGYAAIALAAHYASEYIKGIEYLSGILLEPIAKYFIKVVDKLKAIINEDTAAVIQGRKRA